MSRKLAMIGVLALMATMLSMAPAGANAGHVQAILRSNGSLDVIGDEMNNGVSMCRTDEHEWTIDISLDGDPVETIVVENVTSHIRINMLAGSDSVFVFDCLLSETPTVNGDLTVLGGGEADFLDFDGVTVEDDLTLNSGSGELDELQVVSSTVGDDLLLRGGAGFDVVHVSETEVADRMDLNLGADDSSVVVFDSEFGRTQLLGGSSDDSFSVEDTDIGPGPRITTGNGDDGVSLRGITSSGRLAIKTGSGNDTTFVDGIAVIVIEPYSLKINNGAGDDLTTIVQPTTHYDVLNGGGGTDELRLCSLDFGANILGFEVLNPCP